MYTWMQSIKDFFAAEEPDSEEFSPSFTGPAAAPQLLSDQQFRDHARHLASAHPMLEMAAIDNLVQLLDDHEIALENAFQIARAAIAEGRTVEPAVEWLIDNFYLIKEQIKEVRAGLPKSYRRELPVVAVQGDVRVARILMLTRELVAHADGRIQLRGVQDFIDAYQGSARLTLGELWAIPLMLRFVLIEQLRPLTDAILQRLDDRALATEWSDRLHKTAREKPAHVVIALAEMARTHGSLSAAWIVEFQRRMQGGSPALGLALMWLDQQLGARHLSFAEALQSDNHAQATTQVSIGNCIGSLRLVGRTNWSDIVESLSIVEAMLRTDPAGVYAQMDFATRDQYRHVVEQFARRSNSTEWDVVARVLERAGMATPKGDDSRMRHVGYWLVGAGRAELERELNVRNPPTERVTRHVLRSPNFYYVGAVILLTAAIALGGVPAIERVGPPHALAILIALVVAASHLSVAIVNWLVTRSLAPQSLPRLSLESGVPDTLRTIVAIPCLLTSDAEASALVEALEIRYLANRDENIYFALLADFVDAPEQHMPHDAPRLAIARAGIEALNRNHEPDGAPRFCLFVRERRWNASSSRWMGYERKRGKLMALNRFVRGHSPSDFEMLVGDMEILSGAKYVIALDADTELPPQSAQRLIATLAHPLNRPRVDHAKRRVVEGYGILQPRVSVDSGGETSSLFARLHADEVGLDPYTRVVSDVYQDLFGEASFIGKGIYDIDAFSRTTGSRFPDNLILSHDLVESAYARAGLVTDVELLERHPDNYSTEMRRRHRWTRGDWQILSWLLPRVPGPRKRWLRNTTTAHHRWKLLDNLRRSIVPLALFLLLLNGWLLSTHPVYWSVFVVAVIFASPVLISLENFLVRNPRMNWQLHLQLNVEAMTRRLQQTALQLVMLPFEAIHFSEAIFLSLWRQFVSRRLLLQWTEASEIARRAARSIGGFYRMMAAACVAVLVIAVLVYLRGGIAIATAAPFLLIWAASPLIAWALSRPRARRDPAALNSNQRKFLGTIARRTWYFFDTFVTEEHHALPPDNHQEYPAPQTAHRTSPTNIGMYLTGALSAADFGYITPGDLVARVQATLATLESLPRTHGHFLNWYDTKTLEPLNPAYISSVDSGNLLGCLYVLARGLETLDEERLLPAHVWSGMCDTWHVYRQIANVTDADVAKNDVLKAIQTNLSTICAPNSSLRAQVSKLQELGEHAQSLASSSPSSTADESTQWLRTFANQCLRWHEEAHSRAPWLKLSVIESSNAELTGLFDRLDRNPSLRRAGVLIDAALKLPIASQDDTALRTALESAREQEKTQKAAAAELAVRCRALCEVDYDFLWVPEQRLLSIGYHIDQQARDSSTYDLLASEARLASFIGIAQGKLPRKHWFALGRLLTMAENRPTLVSWSGSMFEYLMPLLLMPAFENTLLTRSCRAAVARQIAYGREQEVPWGISESAYNVTDSQFVYQYRAFGVPGLGLKRGLADDLVIAPYASAMSLLINPEASCRNLLELEKIGAVGEFGFFDALDFTASRVPADAKFAPVRTYMAHHQGMILAALSGALNDNPLQRRFQREPMFRANQLLLQEKVPAALTIDAQTLRPEETSVAPAREAPVASRMLTRMSTTVPQVQLLSNGRYHLVVSQAGGGYSQWGDLAVNNWREDATRDSNGIFCFVQDLDRDLLWSNTYQPTRVAEAECAATFAQATAEFYSNAHGIYAYTRIAVSTEDDIELRRVTLINRSGSRRRLALTSYAEIVLSAQAAEESHPAFNKLFVETEFVADHQTILARRRARSSDEQPPTFLHLMGVRNAALAQVSYETRRDTFVGRGGTLSAPAALATRQPLANRAGAVLDSIAALRREIVLEPGAAATVDIVTGMAATRDAALDLAARYSDRHLGQRVFDLAWTREQVTCHQLGITQADAMLFARFAGSLLYADSDLRARTGNVAIPTVGQSGLWKYGISGDLPIVLVRIGNIAELPLVKQLLQAHSYWFMHGIRSDLVIWNEDASGYRQELHDSIMGLVTSRGEAPGLDRPGGVFVRRSEHIGPDDRLLLQVCARITLDGRQGNLSEQMPKRTAPRLQRVKPAPRAIATYTRELQAPRDLQLFNGLGGFSADGKEYEIWLPSGTVTPAPWANVLANPDFGSVISESGGAYTFGQNAHEIRLTPWYNDAITDQSGEGFYVRDEETRAFWSPTPLPTRGERAYRIRHGFGYSVFETIQADIASTLTVFVAAKRPIKYSVLKLRNESATRRKLSVFACIEWVLGDLQPRCASHVRTTIDSTGRAIYANNYFNDTFAHNVGFFAVSGAPSSSTGNRAEFLGRNGSLRNPLALHQPKLNGAFGIGMDPCAAWQLETELGPGEEREFVFALGIAEDADQARDMARSGVDTQTAAAELEAVRAVWRDRLGRLTVTTQDVTTNLLVNGWLVYQVIACRLWARSGYYQSGGAYGFRDQLQDVVSLLAIDSDLSREQILRCAAHQFPEGDVQHWWHPPGGRGVRTHFSDDYLWLPWAVANYVEVTGDKAILDQQIPYLEGRLLRDDEESYYDFAAPSARTETLYEHCKHAIEHGLRFGSHGLPLIGSGDWNDGFNRIGQQGKGESVWLAFFLIDVMHRFAPIARERNDADFEKRCADESNSIAARIDENAWDGAWYRRAYTDDGTPIGSAQSDECKIDSLPQSWASLTNTGDPSRRKQALDETLSRLVREPQKLVQLFDPPFDHGTLDPGYIKGYIPGTRENGGQYTHAAVWLGMACAAAGRHQTAWDLLKIINPLHHASTKEDVATYRIEPYVVAADVYNAQGYEGRGGWSWYTGSAGWMYRFITESLLGIRLRGNMLHIEPRLPAGWSGFSVSYRFGSTDYSIEVVAGQTHDKASAVTHGEIGSASSSIELIDDGKARVVRVEAMQIVDTAGS
jgi:cyclic beta-1,2-glucan synthetase